MVYHVFVYGSLLNALYRDNIEPTTSVAPAYITPEAGFQYSLGIPVRLDGRRGFYYGVGLTHSDKPHIIYGKIITVNDIAAMDNIEYPEYTRVKLNPKFVYTTSAVSTVYVYVPKVKSSGQIISLEYLSIVMGGIHDYGERYRQMILSMYPKDFRVIQ